MLTSEEKEKLARLRKRAAKRGLYIRLIDKQVGLYSFVDTETNCAIQDSPRTNNLDEFELALDELDAQDNAE